MSDKINKTRNFCIIAHIDHGKSTLSDRIIETTNTVEARKMEAQILDSLDIERERGITVKSAVITLEYESKDGHLYTFNLIDTPGHVDFSYEVSRSLAACEGALLIVDAAQGIEAQTLANFYLAFENNLTILPVVNKIDLPSADVDNVSEQIDRELGLDKKDIVPVSAKGGMGIDHLLEKIITFIPPPPPADEESLKALIFDSYFDSYRGAVVIVRMFSGCLMAKQNVKMYFNNQQYTVEEVGRCGIARIPSKELNTGDVGYVILGIKSVSDVKVGDTITDVKKPCKNPLAGYQESKPMVFAGIYPMVSDQYNELQIAIEKLKLNDASLQYEKHSSAALGFGFRCGFLGLLHMEIIQERLSREFNMEVILTAPSVNYKYYLLGETKEYNIDNPIEFPNPTKVEKFCEPFIKATIFTPSEYLGAIMQLVRDKRGEQKNINYVDKNRIEAHFEMPLAEIVFNFYDSLKSITKGYASLDYEIIDFRPADIIKVDIMVNKEPVDALSFLVHKDKARERGRDIIEKLKGEISRHMFAIPLQACIGATVIARETISAMRKDVTAKCYGGDISRKRKLLEKQKEGKKKMKLIGNVDIPQKAFINVLKN